MRKISLANSTLFELESTEPTDNESPSNTVLAS